MSHIIYSTEAVVLKTAEQGESSKLFWLFTEQFGLVLAHAQGVRAGHSKLKHELQLYNIAKVSLVRGREYWRVVNVAAADRAPHNKNKKKFMAEAADFVLRLVHGEGVNPDIFNYFVEPEDNVVKFKAMVMVSLGYLSPSLLATSNANQDQLNEAVEAALAHSHL